MAMPWKAVCWLSVTGLAWLNAAPAQADGLIPGVKIDAGVNAWFKIYTPQKMYLKGLAPWYTYFPYDPAMMGPPPGSRYPNWPNPVPPPQPPGAPPIMPPAESGQAPRSPLVPNPGQTANAWQAPAMQPVGYFHTPVPSYWFAR